MPPVLCLLFATWVITGQVLASEKTRFCRQPYFDSVFFDGQHYRFVVKRPATRITEIYSAQYDAHSNQFHNFTRHLSDDSVVLQSGIFLDFAHLYIQFYYWDPVGHDSTSSQLDFNAYRQENCDFLEWPQFPNGTLLSERRQHSACSRKRHDKLFSPQALSAFTAKYRVFLFEPKSRLLWTLVHQTPPYYGWVKLRHGDDDYRSNWKFAQVPRDQHLYTGAFTFKEKVFVVQENVSAFGLRYPNVVREVKALDNFTLTDFQKPLNQFFGCDESPGLSNYDPDERMKSLNSFMLILTSVLLAFLVLALFIAFIVHRDNKRVFARLVEKLGERQKKKKKSSLGRSKFKTSSTDSSSGISILQQQSISTLK